MKNTFKSLGIAAALAAIGLSFAGCGSAAALLPTAAPAVQGDPAFELHFESGRAAWSAHPSIHPSDYVVIGSVVIRNVNQETMVADLMTQAIAMGGHDVINVRVDTATEGEGRRRTVRVTAVSAVVIRFVETPGN